MQGMNKKNLKVVLPMLAAAAAGVWMVPSAKADFTVTIVPTGTTANGLDSIYVVEATNNGKGTTNTTTLLGIDATITTPATQGGIITHIEGAGSKQAVAVDGSFSDDFFGDGTGGTFIGIGDQPLPTPPTAFTDPNGGGSQSLTTATAVFTSTNVNSDFSGPVAHGNAAVYKGSKSSTYDSGFTTAGTLHALEVAGTLTAGNGVDTSGGAIPIANVVVPTGTPFSINGVLTEDFNPAPPIPFSASFPPVVTTVGATISLTASASHTSAGTATVTGPGNGSYNEVTVTPGSGATVTGSLGVAGFNPATDEEIFGLDVLSGGSQATTTQLATLEAELQTSLGAAGTVSLAAPGTSGTVLGSPFNLFVDFTAPAAPNGFLNYDLSTSTVSGLTIGSIGVVPEPTGVGVLVLGGMGLLARRRRMNQVA